MTQRLNARETRKESARRMFEVKAMPFLTLLQPVQPQQPLQQHQPLQNRASAERLNPGTWGTQRVARADHFRPSQWSKLAGQGNAGL